MLSILPSQLPGCDAPLSSFGKYFCTTRPFGHGNLVFGATISSDGAWIASGRLDQGAILWNTVDGERYLTIKFQDHTGSLATKGVVGRAYILLMTNKLPLQTLTIAI